MHWHNPRHLCAIAYKCLCLDKIDAGIAEVREDLSGNNLRSQSYGWALVAGGLGDTAADYVANTRMPQGNLFYTIVSSLHLFCCHCKYLFSCTGTPSLLHCLTYSERRCVNRIESPTYVISTIEIS